MMGDNISGSSGLGGGPTSSTPAPPVESSKELEYAQTCVDVHSKACIIGIKSENAILLVARKPACKPLETTEHSVIHKLSDNMLISACGFGRDSDHVIRKAQVEVVSLFTSSETSIQSEHVVSKVSDHLSYFATKPEYRPLGVSVLIAGITRENRKLSLHTITPGGSISEARACCIGCQAPSVMAELAKCSPEIYTCVNAALKCAIGLVQATGVGCVQVGLIRDGAGARILSDAEVNAFLR